MLISLFRKVVSLLITIFLVSIITFFVFQILPGNPAYIILGIDADEYQIAALEEKLNLDKPVMERYLIWAKNLLSGDLGESIRFQKPVANLIADRLEVTMLLTLFSLILSLLICIPLATILVINVKSTWAKVLNGFSQIGLAIPSFWLAIVLVYIFAIKLRWLPSGQYERFAVNPWLCIRSLILPSISLAIGISAILVRYLSNSMLDQMGSDYVRVARSKGLKEREIIYKHVLRNALLPMLTILGMMMASVLGGSIVIESVFSLPGIGNLIAISIGSRDLPLIQSLVVYLAFFVVLINFIVDLLYTIIDPRIRLG